MADTCPTCGQRVLMRYDVQLSPKLADIFDAVAAKIGDKKELAAMFYGNTNQSSMRSLVCSINHINKAFEWMESPIRIKSTGHNMPYRIEGI